MSSESLDVTGSNEPESLSEKLSSSKREPLLALQRTPTSATVQKSVAELVTRLNLLVALCLHHGYPTSATVLRYASVTRWHPLARCWANEITRQLAVQTELNG